MPRPTARKPLALWPATRPTCSTAGGPAAAFKPAVAPAARTPAVVPAAPTPTVASAAPAATVAPAAPTPTSTLAAAWVPAPRTKTTGCVSQGGLPDPACTPG